MPNPTPRLDEIEVRLNKATPGPWTEKCKKHLDYHVDAQQHLAESCTAPEGKRCDHASEIARDCTKVDATFIAHAPSDIRYLIDQVRALREGLEKVCKDKLPPCDPEGWGSCTCNLHEPIKSALDTALGRG